MTGADHGPLIALISATPVAIPPAAASLARDISGVRIWNLLDDRLLSDANDAGGLTDELVGRMERLIEHAIRGGADGVLLTCSMYGPVAHATTAAVPVLAADDAAFAELPAAGHRRVLVLASLETALADALERLQRSLAAAGAATALTGVVAEGAFAAANADDQDALVRSLEAAVRPHLGAVDAVLLAQFSLAPASARLAEAIGLPVVSGPDASAAVLAERLAGR